MGNNKPLIFEKSASLIGKRLKLLKNYNFTKKGKYLKKADAIQRILDRRYRR